MTRKFRLGRAFATVGLWTMASRVLGFVRDILIAAFLGAGPVAEAFFIAFSLPNMFRRFFAEGAFNMAFVPMFSKKLEAESDAEGFASDAMSGLGAVLIVLTLLATLFMPWLVLAMASGFAADNRLELATAFGRIAFPYILFISLAALFSGVLNAAGRFVAAAAAPVLLNVLFIGVITAAHFAGWPLGQALAWTVPVAGIAQLVLVWWAAARAGFRILPRLPRLTPELRRLAIIAAPAALAGGVVQINLLVGRQVASFFEGAIVWLNIADRLYQLPLGVIGIAVGVVLLPDLSRRLQSGDTAGAQAAFSRSAEFSMAFTIPSAVALAVIPLPIVSVLFQRGAFLISDSQATALALAIYALGLPAFVLQKVLQPLYFAREDTRRPFRFAVVAMVINAVVAVGLAPFVGYLSAAIATTAAAWMMVILLSRGAHEMGQAAVLDRRFHDRLWRITAASALMGLVLIGLTVTGVSYLGPGPLRFVALAVVIVAGIVSYGLFGVMVGAFRPGGLRMAVRR